MKKILSLVLSLILCLGAISFVPVAVSAASVRSSAGFADVKSGAWYENAVYTVDRAGLMLGSFGFFRPNAEMRRCELATVLARMSGEEIPKCEASPFDDVAVGSWYCDAVAWAKDKGIVGGVGDGKFSPDGTLTREAFCTMLDRYFTYAGKSLAETVSPAFTDAGKVSGWAAESVGRFSASGLIGGYPDGTFKPDGATLRAHAAEIFSKMLKYLKENKASGVGGNGFVHESGSVIGGEWYPVKFLFNSPYELLTSMDVFNMYGSEGLAAIEKQILEDRLGFDYFSADELKNGIEREFFRRLVSDGIPYPCINGGVDFENDYLQFKPYGYLNRPSLSFGVDGASVEITYYCKELEAGIEENGTAWLIHELHQRSVNVDGYDDWKSIHENYHDTHPDPYSYETVYVDPFRSDSAEIFEKEYTVMGRKVKALVTFKGQNEADFFTRPTIEVALDGMVIRLSCATLEEAEQALEKLSVTYVPVDAEFDFEKRTYGLPFYENGNTYLSHPIGVSTDGLTLPEARDGLIGHVREYVDAGLAAPLEALIIANNSDTQHFSDEEKEKGFGYALLEKLEDGSILYPYRDGLPAETKSLRYNAEIFCNLPGISYGMDGMTVSVTYPNGVLSSVMTESGLSALIKEIYPEAILPDTYEYERAKDVAEMGKNGMKVSEKEIELADGVHTAIAYEDLMSGDYFLFDCDGAVVCVYVRVPYSDRKKASYSTDLLKTLSLGAFPEE